MCVDAAILFTNGHELAGLIGRDQQRDAAVTQQGRQVGRVRGAKRLGGGLVRGQGGRLTVAHHYCSIRVDAFPGQHAGSRRFLVMVRCEIEKPGLRDKW